jgi:predicted nucleotidyltransferase
MRLSAQEQAVIRRSVSETFGPAARVYLFGSRIDDSRSGGDIDLYVETDLSFDASFEARTRLTLLLEERLGEQKIDLLIRHAGMEGDPSPVYRIAEETGIQL